MNFNYPFPHGISAQILFQFIDRVFTARYNACVAGVVQW